LRALPPQFRKFLVAVGCFGAGDFAHSMLILLAAQKLAPAWGPARAAGAATGLYVLHNLLYCGFAFVAGWLADRFHKGWLLAASFFLAAAMALCVILLPLGIWTLALVFMLGGIFAGMQETLEDSLCAELVGEEHHGMAFGTLATVNGVGDLISSLAVGLLWSAFGTGVAFAYSGALSLLGGWLILRTPRGKA
jgi:MFS family permease